MAQTAGIRAELALLAEQDRAALESDLEFYQQAWNDNPGSLLALEGMAEAYAGLGSTWRAARIFERLADLYAWRADPESGRRAEERLRTLED